jgi:hypothetical protein
MTPTKTGLDTSDLQRTPPSKDEEIKGLVDRYLERCRPSIRDFLNKPDADMYEWWSPSCDNPKVAKHFAKLRIPCIEGKPRLLLHDLGGSVVEPKVVDDVFEQSDTCVYFNVANVSGLTAQPSSHLINTSGSGKTRILFEGLVKHWGLYFTCADKQVLGSNDMNFVLQNLPTAMGFTTELSTTDPCRELKHNREIARRRFLQVLTARLLVLHIFLEEVRAINPKRLDIYRERWLILQLRPMEVVEKDIFQSLTVILNKASNTFLGVHGEEGEACRLSVEIRKRFIPHKLYLVLDEAQVPARSLRASAAEPSIQRPILREILSAWEQQRYIIVVAGTGLSVKEMKEAVGSRIVKPDIPWRTRTHTGAFDSREAQSDYVSRYLPPHLVQSDSGRLLLQRCWSWLRGRYVSDVSLIFIDTQCRSRHRFTATFLEKLIAESLPSPHKLFDEYIFAMTCIKPSDTPKCAESEPDIKAVVTAKMQDIPFVDLAKITKSTETHLNLRS